MKEEDIEKFFTKNKLDRKTQIELEERLQTDPDFRHDFALLKKIEQGVKNQGKIQLKKHLQQLDAAHPYQYKPKNHKKYFINYLMGGLLAAAIIAFVVLWFSGEALLERNKAENTFVAYYETMPNYLQPITRNQNPEPNTIADAMNAYEQQDYKTTIKIAKQLLDKNPQSPDLRFYFALSLLADDAPQAAIKEFEKAQIQGTKFEHDAMWYAALASLKLDKKNDARTWLNQILDSSDNTYQAKAKALLKEIAK
ncbi:MAG: hypothetical protein JJT94_08465 [Bernardetiaceae bacterium]|nr:hypothetical protein [Bernardetiaceae bacterium]